LASRRWLILVLVLVVVSPLFGVIGAEIVGYHEPLDLAVERACEKLGIEPPDVSYWSGLLPDYTVPGLNDVVGYIISGLVGVAILLIPYAVVRRRK